MKKGQEKMRIDRLFQWRESEEYQSTCVQRKKECERLIGMGRDFLSSFSAMKYPPQNDAVKVEYACGGDIHRGFYCPSPVLDIVIGNVHRGRILNQITAKSKVSHRYGFDEGNKLIYIETMNDGDISSTEYIIEAGNYRYGFTIDTDYELEAISEEVFENHHIARYTYVTVYPDNDGYFCANLHVERFYHDENGLKSSEKEEFQPYVNVLEKYKYDFERKDGYLTSYTFEDYATRGVYDLDFKPHKYLVRLKRKA